MRSAFFQHLTLGFSQNLPTPPRRLHAPSSPSQPHGQPPRLPSRLPGGRENPGSGTGRGEGLRNPRRVSAAGWALEPGAGDSSGEGRGDGPARRVDGSSPRAAGTPGRP
nr:formin-like protein 18 isoform X2 [Macaca fascicularis]